MYAAVTQPKMTSWLFPSTSSLSFCFCQAPRCCSLSSLFSSVVHRLHVASPCHLRSARLPPCTASQSHARWYSVMRTSLHRWYSSCFCDEAEYGAWSALCSDEEVHHIHIFFPDALLLYAVLSTSLLRWDHHVNHGFQILFRHDHHEKYGVCHRGHHVDGVLLLFFRWGDHVVDGLHLDETPNLLNIYFVVRF